MSLNQALNQVSLFREIQKVGLITLGSALLAAGVAFFLLPAKIATGGTPGIAIILHFLFSLSTGTAMLLVNIPLVLAGMKFINRGFALRTLYVIFLSSVLVDWLPGLIDFPSINSLLLTTLYGGTLIGAGVGLVLKGQASAGGTTIIARILAGYWPVKPTRIILTLDVLIIVAIGFIFADMEVALWSMLSIYATTQVIDKILTGALPEKIVHIVSPHNPEIGAAIRAELKRDGTVIYGQNLAGDQQKSILFVVVDARRIPTLKSLVTQIDPQAIMIIMEASEMSGSSRMT